MSVAQQPTSTGQETAPASPVSQPKRRRLLLIEDDGRARLALWDKFKNAGFEVDLATNGNLAMEKLRAATPDAIFMDLLLPYVKGVDVIKEARRDKRFADRPIFVCTSAALMNVWTKRGTKAGATRVFDKAATPIDEIVRDVAKAVAKLPPPAAPEETPAKESPAPEQSAPSASGKKADKNGTTSLSLNPMKFLKSFGRRKKEQPPESPVAATPPPPVPPPVPPPAAVLPVTKPDSSPVTPQLAPQPAAHTPVGVFTVNAALKIASADASAAKMFGWGSSDLVGRELKSLLTPDSETEFAKVVQQAGNPDHQLISVQVTARRKDGTHFPASITRLAWSSDTVTMSKSAPSQYTWTAVFRDLTPAASNTSFLATPMPSSPRSGPAPSKEAKELAETRETLAMLRGANQGLQKQLEALSVKVAASTAAAEKAEKHRDELKARVQALETDAARSRATLDTQTKGRHSTDTQLRHLATEKFELEQKLEEYRRSQQQAERVAAELTEAKTAVERAEAARKQEATRAQSLQQEIDRLRQGHNELKARLDAELQQQRAELEGRLRASGSELDRARGDREQRESELRAQLTAAKSAAQQAGSDLKEKTDQCHRFETELATLQRLHQELSAKLASEQRVAAESRQRTEDLQCRLAESDTELKQIRAQRAKDQEGQSALEATLQTQLADTRTAVERVNERASRFEEELAALRQERDDLDHRFAAETDSSAEVQRRNRELEKELQARHAELERFKSERDQQAKQGDSRQSELQEELEALKKKNADLKESAAQVKRLEREVANLREERHELHTKCVTEKQAGTTNKRRIKELEKQLREIASGFATAKLELEKRAGDRGRLESELQAELEAAKAAQHEQTVRANLLENELGQVCGARDELRSELEVEQHKVLAAAQRTEELEIRLREQAAELARARAAAENQAAAGVSHSISVAGNTEEMLRDLFRLRENEAAHSAEVSELERRVRDSVTSLARVTTDLESERSERRRVEQRLGTLTTQLEQMHLDLKQHLESERANQGRITELEQHLRERDRMLIRFRADLQKEAANRDLAEQQLQAVGDMSAQLRQYLSLFEESKKVFQRTQDQLEAKVRTTHDALAEAEAKLQKEAAERQGLEASLAAAQRSVNEQYEQKVLELARLQSELQVEQLERKRLESDAQHSRFASLDSTRVARTMMNSLRRQLHEAIDGLMQATRRLLEISSEGEQKKLVQSVLENALMLQSSLEESAPAGGDSELRSAA